MNRYVNCFIVLLVFLMMTACNAAPPDEDVLKGRVMIWYSGSEQEIAIFNTLFDRFTQLHPQVTIIRAASPAETLVSEFEDRTLAGVGPDLVIAPTSAISGLLEQGLLQDLSRYEVDTSTYLASALSMVQDEERLYGLPLSLRTQALYYNTNLAPKPPDTLSAFLDQAHQEGYEIAFPTNFYDAFWGVSAFGGQLFDEAGRVVLSHGSFANWLSWLQDAQEEPSLIMRRDSESLKELFLTEKVAYYIGPSTEFKPFEELLGTDVLGVAPLPAGPHVPAGPFLEADALLFSTVSTANSTEIGLRLARFLTNIEQQRRLALEIGKIPVNAKATISPRIAPNMDALIRQSRTAVPIRLAEFSKIQDLSRLGDDIYTQALEGELDVAAGGIQLSNEVNALYGFEPLDLEPELLCEAEGSVTVWHSWSEAAAEGLDQLRGNFMEACPRVSVELTAVSADEFMLSYQEAITAGNAPDLLLHRVDSLHQYATLEIIQDISGFIEPQLMQQYLPSTQQVVKVGERLYGLPISTHIMALYYKPDLGQDPPRSLDDLLAQASPEQQVVIPYGFDAAYWGVTALGEAVQDEDGAVAINRLALDGWLSWLQATKTNPAFVLVESQEAALEKFAEEQVAYMVGGSSLLSDLDDTLELKVAPLPNGGSEGQEAHPLLRVDALMVNPTLDEDRTNLVLDFARFVSGPKSQQLLMEQAHRIPVNINVSIDPETYPGISGFRDQTKSVTVPPYSDLFRRYQAEADSLYTEVLEDELSPADVLQAFDPLPVEADKTVLPAVADEAQSDDESTDDSSEAGQSDKQPQETQPNSTPGGR